MEPRIHSGELLVVDRMVETKDGDVVVARLGCAFTVKLNVRLFGDDRFEQSRRVMKAVDEINARRGRDTIRFGAVISGGRWETKFLRRSRCYTTRLDEVLKVA
jgi:hypothetical protein